MPIKFLKTPSPVFLRKTNYSRLNEVAVRLSSAILIGKDRFGIMNKMLYISPIKSNIMSTELKSIKGRKETEFGYKESEIKLTRFSGGQNGRMVQINIEPEVSQIGFTSAHIQLTQKQVRELIEELKNEVL